VADDAESRAFAEVFRALIRALRENTEEVRRLRDELAAMRVGAPRAAEPQKVDEDIPLADILSGLARAARGAGRAFRRPGDAPRPESEGGQ
jgi:hypothetical protein